MSWMQQQERGSLFLIRTIMWIALKLGRGIGRALLYPISAYFFIFSGRARRASQQYLTKILGRKPTPLEVFHHYHTFSATILDRVYLFSGQHELFDLEVHGEHILNDVVAQGRGCLLLGAHMGSFEILRALGSIKKGLSIKALMYGDNSRKINSVLNALNPDLAANIIQVGSAEALLGINEHLEQGSLLALLGDRVVHDSKQVQCEFLGEQAEFAAAPMLLASILKVPVVLFFCLYRGDRKYEIHFELLADQITIDRKDRDAGARQWAQRYADRLAYYCRSAPYNWFNFYDFWGKHQNHDA